MAGQADGEIIIDTEINSEEFKAYSAEMKQAIKSLNGSVDKLGPSLQNALRGGATQMESFDAKAAELENTIAQLEQKLKALGYTDFETDGYRELLAQIEAVESKMDQLSARRDKALELGVSEDSMQYRRIIYDLTELEAKYLSLTQAKSKMEADGTAFKAGSTTVEYQRLNAQLEEARSKLAALKAEAAGSDSSLNGFADKLSSSVKSAVGGFKGFRESTRGIHKPIDNLTKSLFRLGPALMMARGLMGILRQAVSAFMAENEQLASTLSACWSGIGNILGPIITRVINMVATAVAYITKFLSLLGFVGSSTKKAITGAGGAAEKETEKLHRQLASFDELNILKREEDTSGGGGGGADAAELPEVTLPDWVEQIAEQLKAGNWSEAATILADNLNRMVDEVDWTGLGNKIGYYLNGALEFMATFIKKFDWFNLGSSLTESLNAVIKSVDWKNLGTVLMAGWTIITEMLGGAVKTLDWAALGVALADCLIGMAEAVDLGRVGQILSDGFIGILTGLSSAIQHIDWDQLGTAIWTELCELIENIDWSGLVSAAFSLLGAAVGGAASLIEGIVAGIVQSIVNAAVEMIGYFESEIEAAGGDIVMGILNGILKGIANIGTWIVDNIVMPFITAFCAAFGIASPSTVMMEYGVFIVQGLLLGIQTAWESLITWISEAFTNISETVTTWAADVKLRFTEWAASTREQFTTWATNVKTTVTKWAADVKTSIANWAAETKASVSSWVANIKSQISTCTANVYSTISQKVSQIRSTVASGFEAARSSMVSKMQSAMSTIKSQNWYSVGTEICNGIKNGIEAGWTWLKTTVQNLAQRLLAAAKSALGIHSPSRLFRDQVGLNIGYGVGEGVERSEGSILDSVCAVADAIAEEFNSNDYRIDGIVSTAEIDHTMNGFADKVSDSFAALMDRMQAIAESISFKVPEISMGTILPISIPAAVAASDTDNTAEAIQEKIDIAMEDFIQSNIAGHEATVGVLREILEAVLGIEIGDDVIGRAAARYNRRMNFVKGGSAG